MAIQQAVATETLEEAGGQGVTGMLNAIIVAIEGSGGGHTHTLVVGATDVTSTAAELNILAGATLDVDELNTLDGITATVAELNILDGVTANKDEINVLDGIPGTLTATELGYVDGVTSNIQTQINTKAPTASPSFTGDVNIADSSNITEATIDPYKTIWLPAGVLKPTTTSGCAAVATIEAVTNDIDYDVLDFDTTTDENAFCNFQLPYNYDGGTIKFRFVWTNASGGAAETVVFELSGCSYANDEAIDQAVGTPVEVSDTWIAQGDIHISDLSEAVTLAGTPAGGEWVHLEIMRDVSQDNLTGDCRLLGVQLYYQENQYNHL